MKLQAIYIGIFFLAVAVFGITTHTVAQNWYHADWDYRKAIDIKHQQVEENVQDFPVLISVTDSDLAVHARADGYDILFTFGDGITKLNHEIQQFDNISGELIAWVRSDLSSSDDTRIFMYYGNSTSSNQQNTAQTWNNDFIGVWHLIEQGSGSTDEFQDVSPNANHGMAISGYVPVRGQGKIGYGQQFDGDQIIRALVPQPNDGTFTLSMWVKPDAFGGGDNFNDGIAHAQNGGDMPNAGGTEKKIGAWVNEGSDLWGRLIQSDGTIRDLPRDDSAQLSISNWHYVTYVADGSGYRLFVDGSERKSVTYNGTIDNLDRLFIGIQGGEGLYGMIDEVHFANSPRSSGWISTTYNNQNDPAAFYTYDAFVPNEGETYYSYQSGDWDIPTTWTTDPSGTTLQNSAVPSDDDNVIILNGRTVSLQSDVSQSDLSVDIENGGRLHLNGYTFQNTLNLLEGQGWLLLNSSYYPAADTDNFRSSGGGTVVYQGNNPVTIPSSLTSFNHLRVEMSASATEVILPHNATIYGNIRVVQGTWQINDGSSVQRNIAVNGEVRVDVDGRIRIGSGNAIHELTLLGDVINRGSVVLSNASQYETATNGAAVLKFEGSNNTEFRIEGPTDIYRLILDRGNDATGFTLNISSNHPDHFRLFGPNTNTGGDWQTLPLVLCNGTLKLTSQIEIPSLGRNTDSGGIREFHIPYSARLWIDGAHVATSNDSGTWRGLTLHGILQITNGSFKNPAYTGGISYSGNLTQPGRLFVEGGKVITTQFKQVGSSGRFNYIQSGGRVEITTMSDSRWDSGVFALPDEDFVFQMSGGLLYITNVNDNAHNGIDIGVSSSNYNVTGGTVEIVRPSDIDASKPFHIRSTAPFYNLVIRDSLDIGGGPVTLQGDVTVLNNFYLGNYTLDADGYNLSVHGNMELDVDAEYLNPGRITLAGTGNSDVLVRNVNNTLNIQSMTVEKANSTDVVTIKSPGRTTDSQAGENVVLNIQDELAVNRGILNFGGFTIEAKGQVSLFDRIGATEANGRLRMNGSGAQTISVPGNATGAAISRLEIGNSEGVTLSGNNMTIDNGLILTEGVFDINRFRLTLNFDNEIAGGTFGTGTMIMTDGNNSDGGIRNRFNGNQQRLFPFGSGEKYTPATVTLTENDGGNGYIQINPVNQVLPTLLAQPAESALTYYWRVRHQGFTTTPNIAYDLVYDSSDVPTGDNPGSDYVSGRITAEERKAYGNPGEYISNNTIHIPVDNLVDGSYTAAVPLKLDGSVNVYYSRNARDGWNGDDWHDPATWSLEGHGGAPASDIPGPDDLVQLGYVTDGSDETTAAVWVRIHSDIQVAGIMYEEAPSEAYWTPRFIMSAGVYADVGFYAGTGTIVVEMSNSTPTLTGDFGDFSSEARSEFIYVKTSGGSPVTLPEHPVIYPNLKTEGHGFDRNLRMPDADITINGYLWASWRSNLYLSDQPNGNLNIAGDMWAGEGNNNDARGRIYISAGTYDRTVTVHGDLRVHRNSRIMVEDASHSGDGHLIRLHGNIEQLHADSFLDLYQVGNRAVLEFTGTQNAEFNRGGGLVPRVYQIVMNKEGSSLPSFTINTNLNLGANPNAASVDDKPVVLTKGHLTFNNSNLNVTLTDGGADFVIPSTAGLVVNEGEVRVTGANTGIRLAGLLRASGNGQVLLNDAGQNNYIQYTGSGKARLEIHDNALLEVGGQIRRSPSASGTALQYEQTGGNVVVGKHAAPVLSRGVFEIMNPGSSFEFTNGNLTIVRSHDEATSMTALYLLPDSHNIGNNQTIFIGNSNTPADDVITINTNIPLGSLQVNGTNNPTAEVFGRPLTLTGGLTIASGATFRSDGYDVIVGGNIFNQGQMVLLANTVVMNGGSDQTITSDQNISFTNLEINKPDGVVYLDGSEAITVSSDLNLKAGILDNNGKDITVMGHLTNNATHRGNGALVLAGASEQKIKGNGNGILNNLTVQNSSGITAETPFRINGTLQLNSGVLQMGKHRLTLAENAEIGGTPAAQRMITTNGVVGDGGIRWMIASGSFDITFPLGVEGKYTPVRYNALSNTGSGAITIKPVNSHHPSATGDGNHRLNYYWHVRTNGLSNLDVGHEYTYNVSDTNGDVNNYVTGRFSNHEWSPRFGYSNSVDTDQQKLVLENVDMGTVSYIRGDYTAGEADEFDELPVLYSRNDRTDNDWHNPENWSTQNHGGTAAVVAPRGNPVVIAEGHQMDISGNDQTTVSMQLEGTLDISTTYGHNFGDVIGSGTLVTSVTTVAFPAGDFSEFTGPGGGTVEYSSNDEITMPDRGEYNMLRLSGSGTKLLPETDITVYGNIELQGGVFDAGSRKIELKGDWVNNVADGYLARESTVRFSGLVPQQVTGNSTTTFCNIEIANAEQVVLDTDSHVTCDLQMGEGHLVTNAHKIILEGSSAQLVNEREESHIRGNIEALYHVGTNAHNMGNTGVELLSGTDDLGEVKVVRRSGPGTGTEIFGSPTIHRIWEVTADSQPESGRTLTFSWLESEDNEVNLHEAVVFRRGEGDWIAMGGGFDAENRIIMVNTNTFSEWTVSDDGALPIQMANYGVESVLQGAKIFWNTETERDNYGFYIDRKFVGFDNTDVEIDRKHWEELAFVEGQGTSVKNHEYALIDTKTEESGLYIYRIRQMDFDGHQVNYGPLEYYLDIPETFNISQNYPNPFNMMTTIPFEVASESHVRMNIYDILGRRVRILVDEPKTPGRYNLTANFEGLASGVYFVRMQSEGYVKTVKMMMIK